ncbi:MAG: hypothetical protein IKU86_03530 [Thermoguttaceae bacterium]|nr:hypothetical protein [Thermoguttaceae bacterium]
MAKISGFFMSTLLIVLCLWINVCHYPDATVALERRAETLVVPCDAESSEPAPAPAVDSIESESTDDASGSAATLAETIAKPARVDVSASTSDVRSEPEPASTFPALTPASFPADAAEIDDAAPAETQNPSSASPADESSRSVANSATKPRGAKYVRVPEVEIDGFIGGVRTTGAKSLGDSRVVGATRAEQTLNFPTAAR